MIFAVDFDGTCVTHEYPRVGTDIGAAKVLRTLVDNGHKIILFTMRDSVPKANGQNVLQEAVDWFNHNNIPLFGVNENPEQSWSMSRKVYAHRYIDDAAVGVPLRNGHVDWEVMLHYFVSMGTISQRQADSLLQDSEWLEEINRNK